MRRPVVLAIVVIALAARAAAEISPADALAAGDALTAPARAILGDVLVRSILVGHRHEVAAFIVREAGGAVGCILWPRRDLVFAATFYGLVPSNAIALAHSHPIGAPPSKPDLEAARLLNLPVYIVTRTDVAFVDPSGRVTSLIRGRLWVTDIGRRAPVCRDDSLSFRAER